MLLDLKKLVEGSAVSLPFETSFDASGIDSDVISGEVLVKGAVSDHSGLIVLEGEITPSLTAVCARCGNEFNYSVPTKLYAKVAASLENGDNDDFVIMEDQKIDITEIARSALILDLPSRFLCRDDCRGICQKCGADLNKNPCSCDDTERDPRWNALLGFFDEE